MVRTSRLTLPEYPFPKDLKKLLDDNVHGIMSENTQVYMKILNEWKKFKHISPTESHYLQLLKFALYLEEYQCEKDMEKYDLRRKRISKTDKDIFYISTRDEWVDEDEKPMIRVNDDIDVIDTTDNTCCSLCIVKLKDDSIEASGAKFLERYSARKLYTIKFRYQNYPLRCSHFALWLTYQNNVISYLFPKNFWQPPTVHDSTNVNFFNSTIKSNPEQAQAVLNILHKSSFPYPYILYGPPGTGKTATIAESICQIIKQSNTNRVLVCTPSNTAADEVAKRLLDYVEPELVFRMYSMSQDPLTIDTKILPSCNYKEGKMSFVKYEDVTGKRIVVSTLCNSMKLVLMRLRSNHFSHVIIDEAGQSIEPDILIPVSLISENGRLYSQMVLAGDPKQLGPTVISDLAEIMLGRSILERLMSYPIYQKTTGEYNPKYITKLRINYRSHPDIIKISNELFYNRELIPKSTVPRDKFPVTFYGTFGKEEKCSNSTSSRNRKEIYIVSDKIQQLLQKKQSNISQEDIGVVTPFKLQSKEIKKALHRKNLKNIDVGTVELFQGQEKKIIIISAVRTKKFSLGIEEHIGSLSNPKRFNVAVTRAKSTLIIIGNPNALQIDPSWRYLLKYCMANKTYRGEPFKLNVMNSIASNHTTEASDIILSSDLFKWRRFHIFMLDDMDSKTGVIETMRVILYPDIERVRPIQPLPTPRIRYLPAPSIPYKPSFTPKEKKREWCTIL